MIFFVLLIISLLKLQIKNLKDIDPNSPKLNETMIISTNYDNKTQIK